eukprot:7618577-Karenia_brevis.AAC.1
MLRCTKWDKSHYATIFWSSKWDKRSGQMNEEMVTCAFGYDASVTAIGTDETMPQSSAAAIGTNHIMLQCSGLPHGTSEWGT